MSGKRVLFLGLTGIDKRAAVSRLAKWCEKNYSRTCHVVDFEKDCLFSDYPQSSFLDGTPRQQRTYWDAAWDDLWSGRLGAMAEGSDDVFLSIHGSYIRGHYGSRCILDVHKVAQFDPDLIVTLIADVYDMWWRTERRAQGEPRRGRPTLEQLVLGRRTEVLIGDQIALPSASKPKNLVLAVGHPCDTIAHCIYHESPLVVYLSFPISAPRRMADAGDTKGIEDVSAFVLNAYQRQ